MSQDMVSNLALTQKNSSMDLMKNTITSKEKAEEVGQKFESMFYKMMLKTMRDALPESTFFNSSSMRMFTDMMDDNIAESLSQKGELGIKQFVIDSANLPSEVVKPKQETFLINDPSAKRDLTFDMTETIPAATGKPFISHAVQAQQMGQSTSNAPGVTTTGNEDLIAVPEVQEVVHQSNEVNEENDQFKLGSAADFIKQIWPYAKNAAAALGVNPAVLTAQAALESGWGQHVPETESGVSTNNLFGIKPAHHKKLLMF